LTKLLQKFDSTFLRQLLWAVCYHMGPFHPREAPPVGGPGVVCAGSVFSNTYTLSVCFLSIMLQICVSWWSLREHRQHNNQRSKLDIITTACYMKLILPSYTCYSMMCLVWRLPHPGPPIL